MAATTNGIGISAKLNQSQANPTQTAASPSPASSSTYSNTVTSSPHPVTDIETRSDLSLLFRMVRTCLRPLRPKLVQIQKQFPAGSPRLTKRSKSHYGVEIKERKVQVPSTPDHPLPQADKSTNTQHIWLYDFEPPRNSGRDGAKEELARTIYYFAGGGFKAPATPQHWKLCARMAKELASDGIRVVLVSYPLAPNSPAHASLPLLQQWLRYTLRETNKNPRSRESVTLMGDSSGGNIAIGLVFWLSQQLVNCRREVEGKDQTDTAIKVNEVESLQRLTQVVTISGPMDFTNTNPAILEADQHDPILTIGLTDEVAAAWTKGYKSDDSGVDPRSHPELSPNLQTSEAWQALNASGVRIDGAFGTADVLAPDCRVFMERCEKEHIKGKWLVWEGQMHCFPLTVCYGLKEGKQGFEWLCRRAREP